jgi:coatomer subunit beta
MVMLQTASLGPQELKDKHREVMTEMLMDVLRALSAPNMDIRKKTLDIALDLITQRNIDEVVQVLKKEIMKTQSKELEKGAEYRQLLVQVPPQNLSTMLLPRSH